MNSVKLWIAALVAVSFLAGGVGGYTLATRGQRASSAQPMAPYAERLAGLFELDEQRRADLRFVLDRYEQDLDDLEARYLREQMEDDLVELGERTLERLRLYVIPPEALEEFDALCRADAVLSRALAGATN